MKQRNAGRILSIRRRPASSRGPRGLLAVALTAATAFCASVPFDASADAGDTVASATHSGGAKIRDMAITTKAKAALGQARDRRVRQHAPGPRDADGQCALLIAAPARDCHREERGRRAFGAGPANYSPEVGIGLCEARPTPRQAQAGSKRAQSDPIEEKRG